MSLYPFSTRSHTQRRIDQSGRGVGCVESLHQHAAAVDFEPSLLPDPVDTVEAGDMTKDLALLVGPDQKWLSTTGFLDKVDQNLKAAMAGDRP